VLERTAQLTAILRWLHKTFTEVVRLAVRCRDLSKANGCAHRATWVSAAAPMLLPTPVRQLPARIELHLSVGVWKVIDRQFVLTVDLRGLASITNETAGLDVEGNISDRQPRLIAETSDEVQKAPDV
jgi:hypothetical protein